MDVLALARDSFLGPLGLCCYEGLCEVNRLNNADYRPSERFRSLPADAAWP